MYRSKKEVLSSIRKRSFVKNGSNYTIFEAFLGSDPVKKKKVRIAKSSEAELKKAISEFFLKLSSGGESAVSLSPYEATDARRAFDLLEQHKISYSLLYIVRAFIDKSAAGSIQKECTTTVGEAWKLYLQSISARSVAYQKCVRSRIGNWVASFGASRLLSEVTASSVKSDLMERVYDDKDDKTWKTYNNILGDLKTFIHWCCSSEQAFITEDPLANMKRLEIGYKQPEYMKAKEVEKLFRVIEMHKDESPADLADAILSFFTGMRQIEIDRIREGEDAVKISLEDEFIRVIKCKGSLRGIRPRAFKIPPQALAWMKTFDFLSAVRIPNSKFRRHLIEYAREANIKLPKNAGRHTFITMFEAANHDQARLSAIVGNTESVRSRSYNGVEIEREGKAYFEILPSICSSETHSAHSPADGQESLGASCSEQCHSSPAS